MNNPVVNGKQRFLPWRVAFLAGVALLLVMLVLGALGQWDLALSLVGLVMFLSFGALMSSPLRHVNPYTDSDDTRRPGFLPIWPTGVIYAVLSSMVDTRPLRWEQERIERQQADWKPFVFKKHPQDAGHAEMQPR